jgi:hypothetical protein
MEFRLKAEGCAGDRFRLKAKLHALFFTFAFLLFTFAVDNISWQWLKA